MKHLRLFETEADYNAATLDLPVVSYVKKTGNVYYNGKHAVDRVLNAPLMNMCVANGWAKESNDYLTYEEAAVISTVKVLDFVTYNVVSAWELKYFTGLISFDYTGIVKNSTTSSLFKYIYIPDNYTGECFNVFYPQGNSLFPNIVKVHNSNNSDSLPAYQQEYNATRGATDEYAESILYIGEGVSNTKNSAHLSFFKTIILMCAPFNIGGNAKSNMTVFVKDEYVDEWKTKTPFSSYPNIIHPISEYVGDTDY